MTRVSLKEAYDNKDVVAQIYAIRDIAEGVEDTANNAVSTANTASEHVDALVPQVEGAVQTANDASASAQASAQTVAGYENRLSNVELKITTAEGDIVTIQGRVTALETADGQNVKLSGDQNITGIKTVPTEATGTHSQQIANSAKIGAELDNYAPMVRTTGSQSIYGRKSFELPVFEGSKDTFRGFTKFTDVVREEATDRRCFISSVVDSNDRGLGNTEIGMDNSGQRAYYSIAFGGIVVDGNFLTSQLRLNLSQNGVEMQLFDPINRTWKTAVFQ